MEEKTESSQGIDSMVNAWTRSMNDIVGAMSSIWSVPQAAQQVWQQNKNISDNDVMTAMTLALQNWQAITSSMATPESMAALFKGCGTMPEILTTFGQAVMSSFSEFQKKMNRSAGRWGEVMDVRSFEKMDEDIIQVWTEIYEKEFQKFFQIPQLGLAREYQGRANQMMDKYHLFQVNYAEFLRLLSLPFQRSMVSLQEKIASLVATDEIPEDVHEYYRMWVKILEGHFMTMFQTPEYIEALTKTINSLSDFSRAKNGVMEDLLKELPIALQSEMDEVAREVYKMKRRIRTLENELKDKK